jgi:hypothetical protein
LARFDSGDRLVDHPVNPTLERWIATLGQQYAAASITRPLSDLPSSSHFLKRCWIETVRLISILGAQNWSVISTWA